MNVLVYAFREDAPGHSQFRAWLDAARADDEPIALCDVVLSGFVRVATNPRVFIGAAPIADALAFARALRDDPGTAIVTPGERCWDIFDRLCGEADARGNLVSDAYIAALAIETGCELITTDRDFSRFPGLRWRHPLA